MKFLHIQSVAKTHRIYSRSLPRIFGSMAIRQISGQDNFFFRSTLPSGANKRTAGRGGNHETHPAARPVEKPLEVRLMVRHRGASNAMLLRRVSRGTQRYIKTFTRRSADQESTRCTPNQVHLHRNAKTRCRTEPNPDAGRSVPQPEIPRK